MGIYASLLILLRGVLRSKLGVDLNVLCDIVERLTGLFIMAHKVGSLGRALHGVALPRSWFIDLIRPGINPRKDTSSFFTFASTLIEFLQRIYAQVRRDPVSAPATKDQFTAHGDRVITLTGPLIIARM